MLWKLKVGALGVIVAVTLPWTVIDLCHGLLWQAAATLGAGTLVTLGVFQMDEGDAPWVFVVAGLAFAVGGMGHFVFESPFTNGQRQQALLSLTNAFIELSATPGLPMVEQNEVMAGLTSCVMEPTTDALVTTTDAMKLVYETPSISMADRAAGVGNTPATPEGCINAYRQLRPQVPWAFHQAETESPWLVAQL